MNKYRSSGYETAAARGLPVRHGADRYVYDLVEVNLQHKEERDLASRGVTFLIYESCECFREAWIRYRLYYSHDSSRPSLSCRI